jgi:hypothetical protein
LINSGFRPRARAVSRNDLRGDFIIIERKPYTPTVKDWSECYEMLCKHCARHTKCDVVEGMIEMHTGGAWPEGGWVSDPGAGVTCLSYQPLARDPLPRQQRRQIMRLKEIDIPPICKGCAARKGSEASVSLHTRRDYQGSVRNRAPFVCHEDPELKRLCGGWCRALRNREDRKPVEEPA